MRTITMSQKELKRVGIIQEVIKKQRTQTRAAELLGISTRQIRRLVKRVTEKGLEGLCHQNRGRPSPRKIKPRKAEQILTLYKENYGDFGPTFAQEKLAEKGLVISRESLRKRLIKAGEWKVKKKKDKPIHVWRSRRSSEGELTQIDGSHHRWLEDRLDQALCLMGYIDDATNKIYGRFYEYEGVYPILDSMSRFIRKNGKPRAVYIDRHCTYKTTRKATVEEDVQGQNPLTHFEKVMQTLSIKVIHARSPQAKGRVERLFETLQDRLVKEMRLANIATLKAANEFLDTYLENHNQRFSVCPKDPLPVWRPLAENFDPTWVFVRRFTRTVLNDYTIRWNNQLFLIQDPYLSLKGQKVEICQALDGRLRFATSRKVLTVKQVAEVPKPIKPMSMAEARKRLKASLANHSSKNSWVDNAYYAKPAPQLSMTTA